MQTLAEFRVHWQPVITAQGREIAAKVEGGRNMARFLTLEPEHRGAVDELVREYAQALSLRPENLTLELGYLFHLRLQQAAELAQFLDFQGMGAVEHPAPTWIEILAIDSWHEFTVHKWRYEFTKFYDSGTGAGGANPL